MCAIIRKPATSMPIPRAYSMCCLAMSASVQWVAIRTDRAPASNASLRSVTVPMPGISSVAIFACSTASAATSMYSMSECAAKP